MYEINWSEAPEWAMWHAFDEDGWGYFHECKPIPEGRTWKTEGGLCKATGPREFCRKWKETLTQRPSRTKTQPTPTEKILSERGSRYGKFSGQSKIAQDLKQIMSDTKQWQSLTTSQREALEMIQHKVARILNGDPNYDDSWRDIAGYATLIVEQLNGNDI